MLTPIAIIAGITAALTQLAYHLFWYVDQLLIRELAETSALFVRRGIYDANTFLYLCRVVDSLDTGEGFAEHLANLEKTLQAPQTERFVEKVWVN